MFLGQSNIVAATLLLFVSQQPLTCLAQPTNTTTDDPFPASSNITGSKEHTFWSTLHNGWTFIRTEAHTEYPARDAQLDYVRARLPRNSANSSSSDPGEFTALTIGALYGFGDGHEKNASLGHLTGASQNGADAPWVSGVDMKIKPEEFTRDAQLTFDKLGLYRLATDPWMALAAIKANAVVSSHPVVVAGQWSAYEIGAFAHLRGILRTDLYYRFAVNSTSVYYGIRTKNVVLIQLGDGLEDVNHDSLNQGNVTTLIT